MTLSGNFPVITLAADYEYHGWHDGIYYHAHPCGKDSDISGIESNFNKTAREASLLFQNGYIVISPVVETVPIWRDFVTEDYHSLQPDLVQTKDNFRAKFAPHREDWFTRDRAIAKRCRAGLLLGTGWQESEGCIRELGWFEAWERPIYELEVLDGPTGRCVGCDKWFLAPLVKAIQKTKLYPGSSDEVRCQRCHRKWVSQLSNNETQTKAIQIYEEVWGEVFDENLQEALR